MYLTLFNAFWVFFCLVCPSLEKKKKKKDTFATFTTRLNDKLEALAIPSGCRKLSTQKQRLWSGFHSARISELRRLWTDLFSSLGVDSKFAQDPLLGEYVNEKLFEEHVKERFEVEEQCVAMVEAAELSDNDLNALRYVAGYVPWKLRQKFKKATCKHPNRKAFLVCLEKMSEDSEEEDDDSYMEYTKKVDSYH